ncbi:SurA N-terminal domain-containing protein [Motiliproteus sp. SC1-56]|uniref:SurA N-terminal domain-containing protein n=1 Tax=Motiliproteus sp. SC1-56 TaxID=2799565 RepID=UPI001A904CCC|nr:SurA N-terminal domain-containing protein [Motiliproteus sp. SC1-56]
MLQSMRENSQGIIAKIIVGFIIVTFALWGVDSLVGLASAPDAPVEVNGVEITEQQIREGVELQRRQLMAQMGDNLDPSLLEDSLLRGMVIEGLVQQTLLVQHAREQGMGVADEHMDQIILQTPDFQVDGRFDRSRFEALLRNVGLTPLMYRDYLRKDTLINQSQAGLVATAFALPREISELAALDRQTRDIRYVDLELAPYRDQVVVSDDEIAEYYEANREEFRSPEQVAIEYVMLNKADVAAGIEVEEAELQSEYERLVDSFEGDEAREAAHILIQVNDERSAEEARTLAEDLTAQLESGADFAVLAREYSEDPGSAEAGGDLGYVERGVMVPEFEEALYKLKEGEVSTPVQTDFGYHLIKLVAIDDAEPPRFEEVRTSLLNELQSQRAESLFVARAEELADISFSAADLREPAEALNLDIQTSDFFGREGGADTLLSNPRLLAAAFDPEVLEAGNNSELVELDADRMVVLRVKEHRPAQVEPLGQVREQIQALLINQKAVARLRDDAQEMIVAMQAQGLEAIAQFDKSWQEQDAMERGDQSVPAAIRDRAFKLAKPLDAPSFGIVERVDGLAVVAVTAVNEPQDLVLSDAERQGLGGFIANRYGQADYQALLSHLRANAEIEQR